MVVDLDFCKVTGLFQAGEGGIAAFNVALAKHTRGHVLNEGATLEQTDEAPGHGRRQAGNGVRFGHSHLESLNANPNHALFDRLISDRLIWLGFCPFQGTS